MCEVDHDGRVSDGQLHSLSVGCVAALDQHASIVEDSGQVADRSGHDRDSQSIRHAPLHQMCADETGAAEDGDVGVGGSPCFRWEYRARRRGRKGAFADHLTSRNQHGAEPSINRRRLSEIQGCMESADAAPHTQEEWVVTGSQVQRRGRVIDPVPPAVTQDAETGAAARCHPVHRIQPACTRMGKAAIGDHISDDHAIIANGRDLPKRK